MKNSFKQINEAIDNLYVILKDPCGMPLLEKDIILGRIRELYVAMQTIEVEENKVQQVAKQQPEQISYDVFQGIDDDVDLFFDTEHDSYTHSIPESADASKLVEEQHPESEENMARDNAKPKDNQDASSNYEEEKDKTTVVEVESAPEAGMNDDRTKAKPEPTPELDFGAEQDDVAELFSHSYRPEPPKAPAKPDELITPEPLMADDEDDLLQFVPQRFEAKKAEQPAERPEQSAKPRSLNDLFMERKEDRSLGFQYQHAKVGDLTKAISINEKFTFIKELFNNRGEEFSAAIQQLNQCSNMNEAFDKLETLKQKYFWDSASTAYLSLCDLLRRKFM